jgi:hypothetical protein
MVRWNGSTWTTISTGISDQLWAVTSSPDATGSTVAVGINGALVTAGATPPAMAAQEVPVVAPGSLDLSPAAQRARRMPAPAVRRQWR